MQVVLDQLRQASERLARDRAEVTRLTAAAFVAGATNRQIADATGETTDAVRMRRRRKGATA